MGNYESYDKPGEKCAVVGIVSEGDAGSVAIRALRSLQHRGQEATGVTTQVDLSGEIYSHRKPGLVTDAYNDIKSVRRLVGNMAIGHNKYSTSGSKNGHQQPVIDESIGFSFAHNGNLPNTKALEKKLQKHNVITSRLNDSEMMARTIATHIRNGKTLQEAIINSYDKFMGAFSCVAMHDGQVVAFRDRMGIKPFSYGTRLDKDGNRRWVAASETCALDATKTNLIRDIGPGEMVTFTKDRPPESIIIADGEEKLDIFEFVYFARPDSLLYGERVNEVRRRFGQELANQHTDRIPSNAIVVPVPDTSIPAAEGFAETLGLKSRQGIVKDRYMGRTFILPDQDDRKESLDIKHNIIPEVIKGEDIVLIDDSIVRLNTIPKIIAKVRDAGAKSVTVLIASPPVRYPDYYGMDMSEQSELAASYMTIEEMEKEINANYLGFLSLSRMVRATNNPADRFNLSCFNGEYSVDIGDWANTIKEPVEKSYLD